MTGETEDRLMTEVAIYRAALLDVALELARADEPDRRGDRHDDRFPLTWQLMARLLGSTSCSASVAAPVPGPVSVTRAERMRRSVEVALENGRRVQQGLPVKLRCSRCEQFTADTIVVSVWGIDETAARVCASCRSSPHRTEEHRVHGVLP